MVMTCCVTSVRHAFRCSASPADMRRAVGTYNERLGNRGCRIRVARRVRSLGTWYRLITSWRQETHTRTASRSKFISVCLLALLAVMPASAQSSATAPSVDKKGVFLDSMALLAIEHGIRLGLQPGTRRELRGNFWRDYRRSVRIPTTWEDTDQWPVNYIGHPIHGAA